MSQEAMYLAVTALPIVAGVHRYASNRGYRNQPAAEAFEDAWKVSSIVGLICCAGLLIHKCLYGW